MLRQFVTEVHAWLNQPVIMHDIKGMKATFLWHPVMRRPDRSQGRDIIYGRPVIFPKDMELFCSRAEVSERDELVTSSISLFLDGETSLNSERFWASQLKEARLIEQKRQAWMCGSTEQETSLGTAVRASDYTRVDLGMHIIFATVNS
jgi:hypothetical protein